MHSASDPAKTPWTRFKWQNAIAFFVVCVCTLAFAATVDGIGTMFVVPSHFQNHDFISYWAAAKQIRCHANPYDGKAILQLERSAGFSVENHALIMRNLPPALLLYFHLGCSA